MSLLCKKHEKPLLQLGALAVCPACLAEKSEPACDRVEQLDTRFESDRRERILHAAGIPPRFSEACFENFEPSSERARRLRALLSGYVDDFSKQRRLRTGFIFLGLQGRGKTHLACAMAQGLLDQGFTAHYSGLPGLTARARRTYKQGSDESVADIVSELVDVDFLILDEIDLHGSSDADYQMLYDVINGRYERLDRPTLVISNRPLERLQADLDERIISRILSGSPPINFDWASFRDTLPDRLRAGESPR